MTNNELHARPGLAQLVERLTHRYSESTSLNPSNLTSATVHGDRTDDKPADTCSTRGGSWGMYITFTSAMQIRQRRRHQKSKTGVPKNNELHKILLYMPSTDCNSNPVPDIYVCDT